MFLDSICGIYVCYRNGSEIMGGLKPMKLRLMLRCGKHGVVGVVWRQVPLMEQA